MNERKHPQLALVWYLIKKTFGWYEVGELFCKLISLTILITMGYVAWNSIKKDRNIIEIHVPDAVIESIMLCHPSATRKQIKNDFAYLTKKYIQNSYEQAIKNCHTKGELNALQK